jgi:EAL and modified HD-GYP domain-containing signal transduction protein
LFEVPHLKRESASPLVELALDATWAPVVARDLRPIGFRLALNAPSDGGALHPLGSVLDSVLAGFVGEGATSFPHGMVVLAPHGYALDASLARWSAPRNVLLEVGQDELDDPARLHLLFEVQRHGIRLALRVQDRTAIPRERLPLFQYLVADARTHGPAPAETALLAINAASRAEIDAAFKEGAHAVIGWPLAEAAVKPPGVLAPMHKAVLELIRLVQADVDPPLLERAFKSEPLLAYMLLTLANSPAFVRTTAVSSLSQAIGVLGYQRLVKWLVLLLVIAAKENKALPQIYAACARGLLMENLAATDGCSGPERDNCFIVGAFSLLDKITGRALEVLLGDVALPAPIADAVLRHSGPYAGYLQLAQQLECVPSAAGAAERSDAPGTSVGSSVAHPSANISSAPAIEVAARSNHASGTGLSRSAINSALLQALAAADALQSVV